MAVLPSPVSHSRLRQAWEIASDLLIAIAVIWALPLLLGAVGAMVTFLLGAR
jgi:hypothetical protein